MGNRKNIGADGVSRIREQRKQAPSVSALTTGILRGDTTALARGLTLVESHKKEDRKKANILLEKCLAQKSDSIRIGITGVPGVGKSTFIEVFGALIANMGKKVAVLAIDPTSTVSKGSILGDKTRMQLLVKNTNAFIRPSPSGDSLGGVARSTREGIILCEAAGYQVILIETVGVGQNEMAVHSMVDFFLLLKLAGAGDELQGIKRGIVEMADAIVVNKADGANVKQAEHARSEFERALHLYPPKVNGWQPKTLVCSSLQNEGISEIWEMIDDYIVNNKKSGHLQSKRRSQNKKWFLQTVEEQLNARFYESPVIKEKLKTLLELVEDHRISPFRAAEELFGFYKLMP